MSSAPRPEDGPAPQTAPEESSGRVLRLDEPRVVVALLAIIAVLGLAGAFLVGALVGSAGTDDVGAPAPRPSTSSAPTPTPVPSVVAAPSALAAPGVQDWQNLAGGECLGDFTSPWAERFTVVPCTDPHVAQLVERASLSDDPAAPYPGNDAIVGSLGLVCSAPDVIDYGRAGAYPDVQIQAAYPPDETSWMAGERSYFCFASLASGAPMTDSIAVG